jgi:hypothetical protein
MLASFAGGRNSESSYHQAIERSTAAQRREPLGVIRGKAAEGRMLW